jgi:hypothetical protein
MIVTIIKIKIMVRYLSIIDVIYKTIYLFERTLDTEMAKMLELIGLVLIGIMSLAFVGVIPQVESGLSPVFWICASGTLIIIFYRKRKRKQKEENN